jgi:hypothetical protein
MALAIESNDPIRLVPGVSHPLEHGIQRGPMFRFQGLPDRLGKGGPFKKNVAHLDPQADEGEFLAGIMGLDRLPISVQVGDNQKEFKIDSETKIEGEIAVGKEVQVWIKDGVETKIAEKK